MNESKNLKSQWMKLCKRSRSKSRQIWVIDRDQESWINRDRDEKCDLTGIAQNCQSRYRSITGYNESYMIIRSTKLADNWYSAVSVNWSVVTAHHELKHILFHE